MKKVKLIYFPIVLLLIAVFTILSFVHVEGAGSKNAVDTAYLDSVVSRTNALTAERQKDTALSGQDTAENVRKSVVSFLVGLKTQTWSALTASNRPLYDEEGKDTGETINVRYYRNEEQRTQPWYVVQNETVNFDTVAKAESVYDDDNLYASAGKTISNVVVVVPGAKSRAGEMDADAILVATHLDPSKKIPASSDATDTVMVAAMMEEIERLVKNDLYYENDIVFLFADARYDSSLGIHAFMNQFVGMRTNHLDTDGSFDLPARIKFAASFDSIGTGTASMLVATSEGNSKLMKQYTKSMGDNFSSSFVTDILGNYRSDFDAVKGLNSLNLITFGDLQNNDNAVDSVSALGTGHIRTLAAKKGSMLRNVLEGFGNLNLDDLNGKSDSVYFSVLGLFTVSYSATVSYILGAVVVLIFVAALVINCRKKAFSAGALCRGALMQILVLAASMAAVFVLYLLMALILCGFGVFAVQGIVTFTYFNTGLIIGFTLLTVAFMGLFYNIFKGVFAVKSPDVARGGVTLFVLASAVLSFVYPALAYIALVPAIVAAGVMLFTVLIKDKFKKKFDKDIERLLPYLVPIVFALPLMLPVVCVLASLAPLSMMPIILLPVTMLLCMVAPYISLIKSLGAKLFAKLPQRTIRVKRVVTEQVEDKAKKGKFTEITHTVITNEKTNWKYRHGIFVTAVAVIAAVVIMISASVSQPVGASVYGINNDNRSHFTSTLFDDSLIVSWVHRGSGVTSAETTLQIRDKAMYQELRYILDGYSWDNDEHAYTKPLSWPTLGLPVIGSPSHSEKLISIKPAENESSTGICEVTVKNASIIESIIVFDSTDDQIMKVENTDLKDNITVRLPLNADTQYNLQVVYLSGSNSNSADIVFKQYVWYLGSNLNFLHNKSKDFSVVRDHFADSDNNTVRFGMYFENELTVSYSL